MKPYLQQELHLVVKLWGHFYFNQDQNMMLQ